MKISLKLFFFLLAVMPAAINLQAQTDTAENKPKIVKPRPPKQTPQSNQVGNSKEAKDNFSGGNYKDALTEYLLLYKKDSLNPDIRYKLGICYNHTYVDRKKAIFHLEWVTNKDKCDPFAYYELGTAYLFENRFEDAIKAFNKYKSLLKGKDLNDVTAEQYIDMCKNGQELIRKPVSVTFENLGPTVNSPAPDYNPMIAPDESMLLFCSKRTSNVGGLLDYDGYMTTDIYQVFPKGGTWTKAKNLGANFNSELVEDNISLSPDGNCLVYYIDNYEGVDDIVISTRKGKVFPKGENPGSNINTKAVEGAGCLNATHDVLIFSSDQSGSIGRKDLWTSRKLPDGSWSTPVNLGRDINSYQDEDNPVLSSDGKALYFASRGHNSMGGFDLFRSDWNEQGKHWGEPVNLGYPINNGDDNRTISFAPGGNNAYISTWRPGGSGDLDIYKITFHDMEPRYTVVTGFILAPDSTPFLDHINKLKIESDSTRKATDTSKIVPPFKSFSSKITVHEKNSKKLQGVYLPDSHNGHFIMALPSGEYSVIIEGEKMEKFEATIIIADRDQFKPTLTRHFKVSPAAKL